MDFNLKQWGNRQHESEEQQPPLSAKVPKFLQSRPDHQPPSGSVSGSGSELPLFVSEPNSNMTSNLSAFPDLTTTATRFPRMGSLSLAQWQELELQALIFRYMLVGAAVPAELLVPIKKSLLLNNIASPSYYPHHPLQHYPHNYQSASLLQSWGRGGMDPEPGRCRRTDGKKWRCSRDILMGHKYCERHVHRGRNRSRKPVEFPVPSVTSGAGGGGRIKTAIPIAAPPLTAVGDEPNFGLSGTSPSVDLLHLNQSSRSENSKSLFGHQVSKKGSANERSDGQILRHFLDDWPRSLQDTDSNAECSSNGNLQKSTSTTSLSMSTSENLSDISLKLSTGAEDEPGNSQREPSRLNWASGWGTNQVPSMGGPLAEALRSSSTSNLSPTSVLHELPPSSASEMSYAI